MSIFVLKVLLTCYQPPKYLFSKKRIEENSHHLTSVDLTTSSEKSSIHVFIKKSIDRLKGSDKDLPQVSY